MVRIATRDTGEQGLLDASLFGDMPTLRTRLGRVARIDGNNRATAPRLFVFQHAAKHAPALIEDGLVQPNFLRYLLAWLLHRAFGRLRHILDLQVLNNNHRVVFAGLCAELMQEIVSAIGDTDIKLGNTSLLLLPVAGVCDHPSQTPLHPSFFLRDTTVGIDRRVQCSIRERRKGRDTQINPDLRRRGMHWSGNLHLSLTVWTP